jgi:hypothetical protein
MSQGLGPLAGFLKLVGVAEGVEGVWCSDGSAGQTSTSVRVVMVLGAIAKVSSCLYILNLVRKWNGIFMWKIKRGE